MNIELVERDIQNRELALKRCKYHLSCIDKTENQVPFKLLSQEIFYLQDQLERYYVLFNLLREEQPVVDEMLPKV